MSEAKGRGISAADKNKKIRQDALREQLSKQKLVEQVVVISEKLNDLANPLEPNDIARLKASADLKLKLVNKYLPDLKQTELVGDQDRPVTVTIIRGDDADL